MANADADTIHVQIPDVSSVLSTTTLL
jgi:hypothetical protein